MTRRHDLWPSRLNEYLLAATERPFCWGENDCATFVFGAAEAMTGEDHAASWRGKYKTKAGALKQIKKHGVENLGAWLDKFYSRQPINFSQRGDIVSVDQDVFGAFGIVLGSEAIFLGPDGTEARPLDVIDYSWRVE